jgi:hypothetical protein
VTAGDAPGAPAVPGVRCIGCGAIVSDVEGPTHRYMLAAPGCWAAYTTLLATAGLPLPAPHGALTVDAYAVQHPGEPNPQAVQSVWVHLITLHLALERDWPIDRLVAIRRLGADASDGWGWLGPPASMGTVTAIDVARADPTARRDLVRAWVDGAWRAWSDRHDTVRDRAADLLRRLD